MREVINNPLVQVYEGDALETLRTLPDESVDCCVTSPPYWGLRDYGTATWEGGNVDCVHVRGRNGFGTPGQQATIKQISNGGSNRNPIIGKATCERCGASAIDQQIGLEPSPFDYIEKMAAVFDEVRRVLKPSGTCWVVIGDSYAGSGKGAGDTREDGKQATNKGTRNGKMLDAWHAGSIKPKDLCGIPWRLAFALQDHGWYLRQDIIWAKPNPMPESVTDRCTRSHEYVFMLTKRARYYYDAEAIAELSAGHSGPGSAYSYEGRINATHWSDDRWQPTGTRNRRDVWTIQGEPFAEAHFATFPTKLVELCIKAGSPPDGVVMDPFGGCGTTGEVAVKLGRRALLIELNPQYVEMIRKNLGLFAVAASA